MASRHITNGVGASLPRCQTNLRQAAHNGGDVFEFRKMQLNVLTGRYMADPSRIPLREFGDTSQLIGRDSTKGNLDADHLDTGLTLAVDPILEAKGFKQIADDL